jgi:YbgC/YbaW family acyl-CoA thioester hydrolase
MGVFRYKVIVGMQDTDAAGILFFASQFVFAHRAYERFLESIGFSFAEALEDEPFLLPIVHSESDYLAPLKVGDRLEVELSVAGLGETSFTLDYVFRRGTEIVGRSRSVHVAVMKETGGKAPLPGRLRVALESFRDRGTAEEAG